VALDLEVQRLQGGAGLGAHGSKRNLYRQVQSTCGGMGRSGQDDGAAAMPRIGGRYWNVTTRYAPALSSVSSSMLAPLLPEAGKYVAKPSKVVVWTPLQVSV